MKVSALPVLGGKTLRGFSVRQLSELEIVPMRTEKGVGKSINQMCAHLGVKPEKWTLLQEIGVGMTKIDVPMLEKVLGFGDRGSDLPGWQLLKYQPEILERLALPLRKNEPYTAQNVARAIVGRLGCENNVLVPYMDLVGLARELPADRSAQGLVVESYLMALGFDPRKWPPAYFGILSTLAPHWSTELPVLTHVRAAILAAKSFEDLELWIPHNILAHAGADVTVIASSMDAPIYGKSGYPVEINRTIDQVQDADFDVVIIPGGWAPDYMRRDPRMVDFVRRLNQQGRVVAAICHGGWMLASADIIRDRHVTGFESIEVDLRNAGGRYEDSEVVRDGNLVTSRTPADLAAFCKEITRALKKDCI